MSADCFVLLQQPRRPWLDPEPLKSRFLELGGTFHPDRVHQASDADRKAANHRYAELNAAYQTLREPKDRLLHLYELESGGRPRDIQRIPPGTMDLFVAIGQACRDVDDFLARRPSVTSPLVRVQMIQTAREWVTKLGQLQGDVNSRRDALHAELREMNPVWEKADADSATGAGRAAELPLERLELAYRALSYVARWTEQLQQRIAELAAVG